MSRILFAWELGGGFGHLAAFRPVAKALLARGHEVTLAVRDIYSAAMVCEGLRLQIVPAPQCAKQYGGLADPPLNFSEILMRYGYLDSAMLKALLQGWRSLLALTRAERLVADHAPTAMLAARSQRLSRCTFGNAFSVPPVVSPTPGMRNWVTVSEQRLRSSDAAVISAINAALEPEVVRINEVHEIYADADQLFVGVRELDPYGPRPTGHYLGLHTGSSGSVAVEWPAGEGPRLFAYLRMDYPHIDACLQALSGSGARCLVNLVDAKPEFVARYSNRHLSFTAGHVDIVAAATQCDAVVCHSGLGIVNAMLRAGKPLLLLPAQLEQFLLARNIEKLGAGLVVHPETAAPDFTGALHNILTDGRFGSNAQALAQRCSEPSSESVIANAVARIEAGIKGTAA